MDVSWMTKYIAEGLGTMLLVLLGNGTIAGVTLKGSKNEGMGGLAIARGYGSGGRTIGKMLAKELDIHYYDQQLQLDSLQLAISLGHMLHNIFWHNLLVQLLVNYLL